VRNFAAKILPAKPKAGVDTFDIIKKTSLLWLKTRCLMLIKVSIGFIYLTLHRHITNEHIKHNEDRKGIDQR